MIIERTIVLIFIYTIISLEGVNAQVTDDAPVTYWLDEVLKASSQSGCGHFMDGPTGIAKQMENAALDRLLFLADEDEMEVGRSFHNEISKDSKIVQDHWAKKKVDGMLQKMLPFAERKRDMYRINIVNSEEINAFATLGGYIYLTTGIIDFVDSADELAFIIGHEISHIDKYHTQRKYKKLFFAQSLGSVLSMEALANMALNVNNVLFAAFDQPDEYEADKSGVRLMQKAGYDPERSMDFFTKLEKYQNRNLINKLRSTHPFASDRKSCILTHISNN